MIQDQLRTAAELRNLAADKIDRLNTEGQNLEARIESLEDAVYELQQGEDL